MPSPNTKPLFVEEYKILLEQLRVGNAYDIPEASIHPLADSALQRSRAYILSKIGEAAVLELSAIPYDPNGTSTAAMRRQVARTAEIELVRYYLYPQMRVFFAQGLASAKESWNAEWLLSLDEDALQKRLDRMLVEIDQMLAYIAPEKDIADLEIGGANVATIGPAYREQQCPPPRPGESVYGKPLKLSDILTKQPTPTPP